VTGQFWTEARAVGRQLNGIFGHHPGADFFWLMLGWAISPLSDH